MKTFSAAVALLFSLLTFSAHAQSGMSTENWRDIKIGPFITGGMALNAGSVDSMTEAKSGLALAVGADLYYPFSVSMGFDLGLCYDSRNVTFETKSNSSQSIGYSVSYLAIRPEFNIGGFNIGLGVGLPIGASATTSGFAGTTPNTPPYTITTSDLNLLLEGRAGAAVTLMETNSGALLQLLVQGSYGFGELIKKGSFPSVTINEVTMSYDDTKNNGPIATVEIGVSYLFDLNPH